MGRSARQHPAPLTHRKAEGAQCPLKRFFSQVSELGTQGAPSVGRRGPAVH